jgi:hypothetical protein
MRLQFCSDLHLTSYPTTIGYEFETILEPVAKALVICGDLGDPESDVVNNFLYWASKRWESIFWIPGFTEIGSHWNTMEEFQARIQYLRTLVKVYPNIYLCNKERFFTEDGMLLLCCPFWTRIPDEEHKLSISIINEVHQTDWEWLRNEIYVNTRPIIIATYMSPTYQMTDSYWNVKQDDVFFAAETEALIRAPVVSWITGHIHKSLRLERRWSEPTGDELSISILSNARGYQDENPEYRNDAVLRVLQHMV